MPPKRKASAQDGDQPPATRRRTRSTAVNTDSLATSLPTVPATRGRRALKPVAVPDDAVKPREKRLTRSKTQPDVLDAEVAPNRPSKDAVEQIPVKRQARSKTHTNAPSAEGEAIAEVNGAPQEKRLTRSKTHPNVAHSGAVRTDVPEVRAPKRVARSRTKSKPLEVASSPEASDDELLLSQATTRPVHTPPPRTHATRLIMHSVEISSPRHVNKPSASAARHPPSSPSRPAPRRKVREGTTPPPPAHRSSPSPHPSPAPHIFPSVPPPPVTPRKRTRNDSTLGSPARSTKTLPEHLHHCLHAQKRACLAALRNPVIDYVDETEEDIHANTITSKQLKELLLGTVDRGEGNSCLVIGPRGSGKTRIIEEALASLRRPPIVIRLSGHAQHNDRLALREIARQLAQQTGQTFGLEADAEDEEDENPFAPPEPGLPPPSHLPTLISALPSLARSTVIILESFDLFALHGRQALLYCLLDTAQSCRAGKGSKGITIIGVTTRVDTINLLEKRVKSRFSGRMLRTSGPRHFSQWIDIARNALSAPIPQPQEEWTSCWSDAVEQFLADRVVKEALSDTFSLTRDVRMLSQILSGPMLALSPTNPYPTHSHISATILTQRCPPPFPFLSVSSYPAICLLIAAEHARIGGQDSVTFEMLHESFRHQLRTSQSAPVQVDGGGIGMVRCSREVLMAAFEQLISTRVFVPLAAASATVGREFVRYRCMVEREDVKRAVEAIGQTNLRKWLHKAQ